MKYTILLFMLLPTLALSQSKKMNRRYRSVEENAFKVNDKADAGKYLVISAFVLDPAAGSNKTIHDLSAEGQAALVEAMAAHAKSPKELTAALATAIKESPSSSNIKGSLLWKKRIVLNIRQTDRELANRIQDIVFNLKIPAAYATKVEFISWDKIATETQSIDLGKITASNSSTLSISPEISMAGTIEGKLPGAFSNSRTNTRERTLTSRLAGVNAAVIDKGTLQVVRQSVENENISGNIVIEVTLKTTLSKEIQLFEFSGLFDGSTAQSDQKKVSVTNSILVLPDFGASTILPIDLTYDFRYRKVGKGKRSQEEFDDRISYVDGEVTESSKFNLYDADGADKKQTWEISDGTSTLHLFIDGNEQALNFDNSASPQQVLNWLKQTGNLQAAGYRFNLGHGIPLKKSDISRLTVQLAN